MKDNTNAFVYIGRSSCGCVVGLVTDNADIRTANHVADFIKDGLAVNRHSWTEYQEIAKEETFLACPHGQLALGIEEAE